MHPWWVGVDSDHDGLDMKESGSCEDVSRVHKHMWAMKMGPTGQGRATGLELGMVLIRPCETLNVSGMCKISHIMIHIVCALFACFGYNFKRVNNVAADLLCDCRSPFMI